jgi:hypothetical protein|tara:strand:+ start:2544 stop:2756 length:213 start_codon:yes stop_codon:yes gene_type:complete
MGKIIQFPTVTEGDKIKVELKKHEDEIKLCLDDLQHLNEHIVELTLEYELMLNRLCEIYNIDMGDYKNDS